jgi:hypothetical protein
MTSFRTPTRFLIFEQKQLFLSLYRYGYIFRAKCKAYAAPNLWLICIREVENDS